MLVGWLYWGLTPREQLRSYIGGRWRTCVSWLSYTNTKTTFLSKATEYFSHMLLKRCEKIYAWIITRFTCTDREPVERAAASRANDSILIKASSFCRYIDLLSHKTIESYSLNKRGLNNLQKHRYTSLRNRRRLTYVETFTCDFFLCLTHSHTMTPFDAPGKHAFWKYSGKRRNCS